MSRFLINKLDFFKAITLIIAKALRFQPVGISAKLVAVANCDLSYMFYLYSNTLLSKNYLDYMFYPTGWVQIVPILI